MVILAATKCGEPSSDIPKHVSYMSLLGGLEHEFYVPIQLGMSSFQLTNSYFSEGWRKTTSVKLETDSGTHWNPVPEISSLFPYGREEPQPVTVDNGETAMAISGPLGFQNVPDTSKKSRYEPNQRRFTHIVTE